MKIDDLSQINPSQVQQYLLGTGWEATRSRRSNIELFNKKHDGRYYEITLPLTKSFNDYVDAIFNVVNKIADVEMRSYIDIVKILTAPIADIVRFRRADNDTINGTIPFEEGISLFENARKALYITACDELQPALYHKRLKMKTADAFIENCSFGQTERGSYVATLICPFIAIEGQDEPSNQLSLFENPNYGGFTRRVTTRLMRSLDRVAKAIESGQIDSLQNTDSPEGTISGNLLEALLSLNGTTNSAEIEISTQWAATSPRPKEPVPISVKFNQDSFAPLERVVANIQTKSDVSTQEGTFVGRISMIEAEPNIEERSNGTIILNTFDLNGKVIRARVTVSPQEISLAAKAIQEGLNVKVRGILRLQPRQNVLEYTTLSLLE